MLDPIFAPFAALIAFTGVVAYARDTWRGTTQPNRVSWFLWTVAPLIAFSAQLSEGVTYQSALTFVAGFGPAVVFLVSFHDRQAYWRITKFDWCCGALSLLALILWVITKTGTIAIVLSILADALAATPTIIKSYRHPQSESAGAFGLGVIAGIITLVTIHNWTFATYAFAAYLLLCDGIIYTLVQFPHLRLKKAIS